MSLKKIKLGGGQKIFNKCGHLDHIHVFRPLRTHQCGYFKEKKNFFRGVFTFKLLTFIYFQLGTVGRFDNDVDDGSARKVAEGDRRLHGSARKVAEG